MVSFWKGLSCISMCVPIYTKCSTCKFYLTSYNKPSKCRKIILFKDTHYFLYYPNKDMIEYNLFIDVETARSSNDLCGKNATLYQRRLN